MKENFAKKWQYLIKNFLNNQLFHFLIFSGPKNPAKLKLALEFAKFVHCEQFPDGPCDTCINCYQIQQGIFPDVIVLYPEKKRRITHSIQNIKALCERLNYSSVSGRTKIAIIDQAQYLTEDAQNALLKILEEPKGEVIFILIADTLQTLLPTILSRAQILKFPFQPIELVEPETRELIEELNSLKNKPYIERFEFAKRLTEENKVREFLEVYLYYLHSQFLNLIQNNQRSGLIPLKQRLNLLQDILHLLDTSNINQKLALEIFLMEL